MYLYIAAFRSFPHLDKNPHEHFLGVNNSPHYDPADYEQEKLMQISVVLEIIFFVVMILKCFVTYKDEFT